MTRALVRSMMDQRTLPVLWHQALLSFVQRYKADLASEQRDQILELIKSPFPSQAHPWSLD